MWSEWACRGLIGASRRDVAPVSATPAVQVRLKEFRIYSSSEKKYNP